MKSLEWVYFKKGLNQLYTAETELNCVVLRHWLNRIGVEQNQYFCEQLPNIYDLVDDILSNYMDAIVFYVDKDNANFTLSVARAIQNSGEDVELVLLYDCEIQEIVDFEEAVPIVNAAETFIAMNSLVDSELPKLDMSELQPYTANLFPVKAAMQLGVTLNRYVSALGSDYIAEPAAVIKELGFIGSQAASDSEILLYSESVEAYPHWEALTLQIEKLKLKQQLRLKAANEVSDQMAAKLRHAGIRVEPAKNLVVNDEAFLNGVKSYYTGYYPDHISDGYTKHIAVDRQQINADLLNKMTGLNAANSAIYGFGTGEKTYAEVLKDSKTTDFLLTNYMSFNEVENAYEVSIDINDRVSAHQLNVKPYASYTGNEQGEWYVSLDSKADLSAYIDDIKGFNETGKIKNSRIWKPNVVNQCRWSFEGMCNLNRLMRLKVDQSEVYPCFDCKQSIGTIDNMHFELKKKAQVHIDKAELDRNCDACIRKSECVKCSMLPDFVTQQQYCEWMQSDLNIGLFAKHMFIIKYLFEMAKVDSLTSFGEDEVRVVTKENQVEVKTVSKGTHNYFEAYSIFLKVETEQPRYVAFNLRTRKALSLNQNLFILCELLYKGLSKEEVNQYMTQNFDLKAQEADEVIESGFEILKKYNYLQKGV